MRGRSQECVDREHLRRNVLGLTKAPCLLQYTRAVIQPEIVGGWEGPVSRTIPGPWVTQGLGF